MGDTGFETREHVQAKSSNSSLSAAGALQIPRDLKDLVKLWPKIASHIREQILILAVDAVNGSESTTSSGELID
jgi:hypothetical protein